MSLKMTASREFVDSLVACLEAEGWPAETAHAHLTATTPDGAASSARIDVARIESLFRAAEADLNDPAIGLRAGHRFRVSAHGRTGSIYSHARDLSDVIDLNARYQRLAIDLGTVSEVRRDDRPIMEFRPHSDNSGGEAGDESGTGATGGQDALRHTKTMLMAAYVTAYRWLNWGSGEDLVSVGIPAPACARTRDCARELFRCPTHFDAPTGHLEFTPRAMAARLTTTDAEKRAHAVATLDALLDEATRMQSFRRAVRASIRAAIDTGPVTQTVVAGRLNLGVRDFRRRLRDQDLNYRAEVDAVRQAILAEGHARGDSLSAIAQALGYNDQAALNRAVQRWYGVAPSRWTPDTALRDSRARPQPSPTQEAEP